MKPGTRVLIDGKRAATVLESFPKGSTSLAFPHARLRTDDGQDGLAVGLRRLKPLVKDKP